MNDEIYADSRGLHILDDSGMAEKSTCGEEKVKIVDERSPQS